jgi:uracil-DNA glycosylase family 4
MSLDLDSRQRAMLQEMGIHVWLPETVAAVPELPVLAVPAPTPAHSVPAPQPVFAAPTPAPATPLSVSAIENIALDAINTRAGALKALKTPFSESVSASAAGLVEGIATMDWPALTEAVAACQACELCTGRRAPVFGGADAQAPQRADWLVVGEPPDDIDERVGTPLAEQAGQLLDNMLKAVGVSRRNAGSAELGAYVTNVVKCRPALMRNPTSHELAVCEHWLRREVALVQPKVILAMGRFAAQTLLHGSLPEGSKLPFGKLRGQLYHYQGIPVVVTYHPSYLLRNPLEKARAWADLCLALATVRGAG